MNSRDIFDYKCHTCKQTKEPNEYGYNSQTRTLRVTCNICHQKRTDREDALKLRKQALRLQIQEQQTLSYTASDTTEEEEVRGIIHLPLVTSEEEPVCENACSNRLECVRVCARYSCHHQQCILTHHVLGRCIACGCSTLRYDNEIWISSTGVSSSGAAIPEVTPEPDCEPEPDEPVDLSMFLTMDF
jgi:hypothetical protein